MSEDNDGGGNNNSGQIAISDGTKLIALLDEILVEHGVADETRHKVLGTVELRLLRQSTQSPTPQS